jgi:hypothetical protein
MVDYYKNLTESDLNDVLNLKESFSSWDSYYNSDWYDLYFLGIKKGDRPPMTLPQYTEEYRPMKQTVQLTSPGKISKEE